MKKFTVSLTFLFLSSGVLAGDTIIKVATFDSGFGGFFTAKAIEKEAKKLSLEYEAKFQITHYGDTANAPYGEKTPDEISRLSSAGITKAIADGAGEVFIACNTASTQYEGIKKVLDTDEKTKGKKIVSIIDSSVTELKSKIDEKLKGKDVVRVALLATPFTVKNMVYPKALAASLGVKGVSLDYKVEKKKRWYQQKGMEIENVVSFQSFVLPDGKKVELYQLGPGNWVDMIEHGALKSVQKEAVNADLKLLNPSGEFDVVGEFCTHFPVFDDEIKAAGLRMGLTTASTAFIQQGPLMAGIFREMMLARLQSAKRKEILSKVQAEGLMSFSNPRIYLSGKNIQETKELSRTIFSADPLPLIQQKDFK